MRQKLKEFTSKYSIKFQEQFEAGNLKKLAIFSGFLRRQRKVTPLAFINTLLFHVFTKKEVSLTDHLVDLNRHDQIILTRQSLHQRFTEEAVEFVKSLVNQQLQNQLSDKSLQDEILTHWENVYVHDSNQFALPAHMKEYFKGYGGATKSDSIVKTQHGVELKSGRVYIHQLGDACTQDVTSGKQTLDSYQQGDLLLRDLGYFDLDSFKFLDQQCGTDFVSRIKSKTSIFELTGEKLDLGRLKRDMVNHNIGCIDKQVIIGTKKPVQVRVIITLAPEEVKQERIRKANKQNKSYGHQTSKEFKQYAAFNIYITNVKKGLLSADQIMKLYRLRWQIELVFKSWKSYYKLHHIKACNCYRTLCYLYASLLLILINWEISSCWQSLGYLQLRQPLSLLKLMKALLQYKDEQRKWCQARPEQIANNLWEMFLNMVENTWREKRKNRHNYQDLIDVMC